MVYQPYGLTTSVTFYFDLTRYYP